MGVTSTSFKTFKTYKVREDKLMIKQAQPIDYRMQLDYGRQRRTVINGYGAGPWAGTLDFEATGFWQEVEPNYGWSFSQTAVSATPPNYDAYNAAYAKAYAKFIASVDEGYDRAQLLTSLAERHETFSMVLSRMKQIYKGASQLKAGNFRGFCQTFGIKPKRKHKDLQWTRPRQFSGLWLEYWFGWAPTVADLQNAFRTYGARTSDPIIIAKGGSQRPINPDPVYRISAANGYYAQQYDSGSVLVRISGNVSIANGTLVDLNRLGLLNIPLTAFELIPFSWFAGWFGNIAQVLGQCTDLVGFKLTNAVVSCKAEWIHDYHMTFNGQKGVDRTIMCSCYTRKKLTSLPRVKLVWQIPPHLSPTRGATLASLLVQLFSPNGVKK